VSAALLISAMDPAALSLPALEHHTPAERAEDVPALIAGLRAGREGEVRELHARYSARLTRYALVVCRGDEAAAAEAVQNAFLKAIRSLRTAADESALWAWLARACRTSAMDQHRSARRYSALLGRFAALFTPPDNTPPDDTEAIWQHALATALAALSAEDRALLDDRYSRRVPLAAIAEASLTTERAIEGRLARLREKLRQSILHQLATHAHES
jgi:RNA polymerase sigma-70 factor (ECF subfamily)